MNYFLQDGRALLVILFGQSVMVLVVLVSVAVLLRRMQMYHETRMKQAVDLMISHQQINSLIADGVQRVNEEKALAVQEQVVASAATVRKHVVEEAEEVKRAVAAAAAAASPLAGSVQKVEIVNLPLAVTPEIPVKHGK